MLLVAVPPQPPPQPHAQPPTPALPPAASPLALTAQSHTSTSTCAQSSRYSAAKHSGPARHASSDLQRSTGFDNAASTDIPLLRRKYNNDAGAHTSWPHPPAPSAPRQHPTRRSFSCSALVARPSPRHSCQGCTARHCFFSPASFRQVALPYRHRNPQTTLSTARSRQCPYPHS